MRKLDLRILGGGLLILVGALFLLQEINFIPSAWGIIWATVFGVAGCVFLYVFWTDRNHWWPLIPGLGLLSLGLLILIEEIFPGLEWAGAIFLAGIGFSFWLVYAQNRENWWAVIPGGVLLTLAVVAGIEPYVVGDVGGGIFMIGLGVTFFLVTALPTPQGRTSWALIPGFILLVIGVFLITPLLPLFNYVWPIVLIVIGIFFIIRNFRS
jgi:hypothetical protein